VNDLVVQRADSCGLIQRWCGLRVVAADASVLMPAVRPCLLQRSAAGVDQRLFSLYLPGAELTLHASVHGAAVRTPMPISWKSAPRFAAAASFIHAQSRHVLSSALLFSVFHFVHFSAFGQS
jgi:hypothetical protein